MIDSRGKIKGTIHINYLTSLTTCQYVNVVLVHHTHTRLPLDKYPGLDGVDDAAEARFLLIAPQHQAHLAGEGGGQPIPHLRGHRLRLDVAELVLCVHQAPERRETGGM